MRQPPTIHEVLATCDRIRARYPDEPFGDHWECWGVPICDGLWGDPEYLRMKGEMEHMAMARTSTMSITSRVSP
jgi:hypothetical protein